VPVKTEQIVDTVSRLIEPVFDEMGMQLVDVEYVSQGGRWVLRVYADRPGGITLDDCARISREIGGLMDIKDVLRHEYVLEVSSPGLNRVLKSERDLAWAAGKRIRVRMSTPFRGRRDFTGYLREVREGELCLEVDGDPVCLPREGVKKASVVSEEMDIGSA